MRAVNLIPGDQRRARSSGGEGGGGKGAYVVLGVLGVALAMLVGYVLTANKVNESASQAAKAGQEADRLEAQAAAQGSFTDFASIKNQRLVSVVSTAELRFDWERLMREVSLVMPEGAWLQTTDASVIGEAEATATDPNAAAVGAFSPSATFVGCTRHQSEVATILTRLRQMHRVTDVALNESAQTQGDTEVSFESCGSLYKFDVTVSFEPTAPKEAPRGSVRVPASLGGGS